VHKTIKKWQEMTSHAVGLDRFELLAKYHCTL